MIEWYDVMENNGWLQSSPGCIAFVDINGVAGGMARCPNMAAGDSETVGTVLNINMHLIESVNKVHHD